MNSATQQFIEDAIKGGWNPIPEYLMPWMKTLNDTGITFSGGEGDNRRYTTYQILLDPLAWQATGKTRGWKTPYYERGSDECVFEMSPWHAKMHRFIDNLADGKTIEEALQALN